MAKWGISGSFLIGIILVFGLGNQIYAQYDYPNDPSQVDYANMMPKEDSGKYSNEDAGVSVTFPGGWSGMEINLKDPKSGTNMTSVQVMPGWATLQTN